jgi:hypothetical protein
VGVGGPGDRCGCGSRPSDELERLVLNVRDGASLGVVQVLMNGQYVE